MLVLEQLCPLVLHFNLNHYNLIHIQNNHNHRRPQGGLTPTLPELWRPLHLLKLCSNYYNAKRLQHMAAIVSITELLTLACMYKLTTNGYEI